MSFFLYAWTSRAVKLFEIQCYTEFTALFSVPLQQQNHDKVAGYKLFVPGTAEKKEAQWFCKTIKQFHKFLKMQSKHIKEQHVYTEWQAVKQFGW